MKNDKIKKNQSILVENGKIVAIKPFHKLVKRNGLQIIDGKNKFIMPALSDMHAHLPKENELDNFYKMNLAAGVTNIRVMNSASSQLDIKKNIEKSNINYIPHLHFSHLIKRDLQQFTVQQFDSLIDNIKKKNLDFIKLFSLSDEYTFDNLMKSAEKNDITVCGHYPKYAQFGQWKYIDLIKVLNSNYKSIEHLGGYDQLKTDQEIKTAIKATKKNNVFNCPTLDWDIIAYDLKFPEEYKHRLTYNSLPKSQIDKWEEKYKNDIKKVGGDSVLINTKNKYLPHFKRKQKILQKLAQQNCLLLIGGDAGNTFQAHGFNIHEEMKNWSNIGIDNYTILKSATITPALFFNEENKRGTIEIGKGADLIILDKNPLKNIDNISTIQYTIIEGTLFKCTDIMPTI